MPYRFLEHTADLGIEVTGESLDELFAECLRAQTDCLTCLHRVRERRERRLELVAVDVTDLLVEFLGEAIYLYETEGLVLSRARVEVRQTHSGWSLTAAVAGEEFDLEYHGLKTLLKGVTYHQLMVRSRGGTWTARVIFDI